MQFKGFNVNYLKLFDDVFDLTTRKKNCLTFSSNSSIRNRSQQIRNSFKWHSLPAVLHGSPSSCFEHILAHPPAWWHLSWGRGNGCVGPPLDLFPPGSLVGLSAVCAALPKDLPSGVSMVTQNSLLWFALVFQSVVWSLAIGTKDVKVRRLEVAIMLVLFLFSLTISVKSVVLFWFPCTR